MSFSNFNRGFGISASLTPTGLLAKSDSNSKSSKIKRERKGEAADEKRIYICNVGQNKIKKNIKPLEVV